MADQTTYYNEFFEGCPKLPKEELRKWLDGQKLKKSTFAEYPCTKNLTRVDIWEDKAKFYFLPFMMNCYQFTKRQKLPHFALMCSPTFLFYRDRLHQRNFMETIHNIFFRCMEMCIPKSERIMLLVEKRFHIENPIDGGSQQLYNMLWDYDLSPMAKSVLLPPPNVGRTRLGVSNGDLPTTLPIGWDWGDLNPDIPDGGVELCRRTCWLQDDLFFLCQRYNLDGEYHSKEIIDLSKYPEEKWSIYEKTARDFYFKVFDPKDQQVPEPEPGYDSSDTDLSYLDEFDPDSTDTRLLDSTTDFKEDDEEMNKIIAFFAKMPKVVGLVQGMLDMMAALTRILPLVVVKIDDPKLKDSLTKTVDMLSSGINKVLRICAFLGIKVEKKHGQAIGHIVKDRFKKERKDFLEYEIEELNKSLDALENVDSDDDKKPPRGEIPLDVKPNHLYPQKMPLGPGKPPPIVVKPEPPPRPPCPPRPQPPKPFPPDPIPSVNPPPPNAPTKGENGVQ